MDTTIIVTLVLSAFFIGSILWIVIHSRRQRSTPVRVRQPVVPALKDERRGRGAGSERTR